MTQSVERRFIFITTIVFIAVVLPLVGMLMSMSYRDVMRSQAHQIELLATSNMQALAGPLAAQDDESINHISGLLLSDPNILRVDVRDLAGDLSISQTRGPNDVGDESLARTYEITVPSDSGDDAIGTLTIYPKDIGFFSAVSPTEWGIIATFALAITCVFAAAIIGNRLMIIKPLTKLTQAIEATRRLGTRQHVDWTSKDEVGRLASSFNAMQTLLEKREQEQKAAHQRTSAIYRHTPAMLFSLDEYNKISAVSDYWIEATGYDRDEVIGKNFADFIHPDDHRSFLERKMYHSCTMSAEDLMETTLRFRCSNGTLMDVLVLEKDLHIGEDTQKLETLSVMTDVTELRQSEMRIREQAITDHLTGLYNRQGFESQLDRLLEQANNQYLEVACLFIDLDRFKVINDNLGHAAGDTLLKAFTKQLKPLLTDRDAASRFGGDEFAVLLLGKDIRSRAIALCQSIAHMGDHPLDIDGQTIRLTASIGVALYPSQSKNAAELMLNADMAMYVRKRKGRNGFQMFNPSITDHVRERAEIENDIDQAIENGWFEAHLQPIQDLISGEIKGFEALMRLNHPVKGLLPPAPIIEVAQENGSIGRVGNFILEAAIANLAVISKLPRLEESYVAVNFSALQFEPSLTARVTGLLGKYNVCAKRLVIEITEAILMSDNEQIRNILKTLQKFGCRIALDDFGTGYSSLSYLTRFPVDIIKIDKSFTNSVAEISSEVSDKSRLLVEGICAISHRMNCQVIAEGIENAEQAQMLKSMGIDFGQGFYFERPLSLNQLMEKYQEQHALTA